MQIRFGQHLLVVELLLSWSVVGQWCIGFGAMITLLEPLLVQQYNSLRATAQTEGTLTNQAICSRHSTGSAAGRTDMPSSARELYMSDDAIRRQRPIRVTQSLQPSCTIGLAERFARWPTC